MTSDAHTYEHILLMYNIAIFYGAQDLGYFLVFL